MAKRKDQPDEPGSPPPPSTLYPVELPGEQDHQLCGAAVEIYCRHLDGLAETAKKMQRSRDFSRYENEAAALRDELGTPLANGVSSGIYGRHLPIILRGLNYLVTNLRAAKGTLRALGAWTEPWVQKLEEQASYVQAALVPKFDPQASLPLASEPVWKCPDCGLASDKVPEKCPDCGFVPSVPAAAVAE